MSQPIFLKIYQSGKLITNKQFLLDQISIGSSADGPSVTLADPSVCFWHALIEKRGGEYHVSDLGSPTGTFVNSQPILESVLKHGDQIQIGDFVIHFFIGVPFLGPNPRSSGQGLGVSSSPKAEGQGLATDKSITTPVPKQLVEDQGIEPVDSKKLVEDQVIEPVSLEASAQDKSPEDPIPLFSDIPKKKNISSSPVKSKDLSSSVDKQEKGGGGSPVDSRPHSDFFRARPDSTAPALQEMEETDEEEPILHPQSVKKDSKLKVEPVSTEVLPKTVSPQKPAVPKKKLVIPEVPVTAEKFVAPPKPIVSAKSVIPEAPPEKPVVSAKLAIPEAAPPKPVVSAKSVIPEAPPKPVVSAKSVIPEAPPKPVVSAKSAIPEVPAVPVPPTDSKPQSKVEVATQLAPLQERQASKGTYAPESEIKDLNAYLSPGNGPVIEVIVAWKERALSVHHFENSNKEITLGSDPKADIFCPNLTGAPMYTLLGASKTPAVFISEGVKVSLKDHKSQHSFDKLVQQGLITTYGDRQVLPLNQGQLIQLNFSSSLNVYIRYATRVQKAMTTGLFNFNFSEMMGLMMSFFFMSLLIFYVALFAPQFLDKTNNLEETEIKKATIEFKKKKRVVKLKMLNKAQKKRTKLSIPNKSKKIRKTKKVGIKKRGKQGRLGQVAAKPKSKSKKKTVTSARSGRSVHTKKAGAGPKSPRPDPTKIGLLGVFGKKGTQKVLDKAYSGTGELAGLADMATGHAGQKDAWTGEGIGTKFKNKGAGGKGSALIGVSSGIKTKGRGGGAKGYGRGGSLGQRGMVQLELGTSDWDVAGGVDKNAILRVIRRNKHQLEWCYESSLQKRPDMEGKVLLKWDILNERVKGVKVMNNTTGDSVLARCLMSRLKNFRFTGTGLERGQVGEIRIPFAVTKG